MPADITTENGKVRYNIGDIIEPYLIEDTVIDSLLALYPEDSESVRVWRVTVSCLRILKAQFALESDRSREREGGVEVDRYYTRRYDRISALLDDFEENPPIEVEDTSGFAGIIFGGTSQKEKARVENNPDSVLPGVKIRTIEERLAFARELDSYWKEF